MRNKDESRTQVGFELGACRRMMRNLARVKHLVEIETDDEVPTHLVKVETEERKQEKGARSRFCPDNSQYIRYIQEI